MTEKTLNKHVGWWVVAIGLLAMYLPMYYTLANTLWNNDIEIHGPIVLAVSIYLIWQSRQSLLQSRTPKPWPVLGWLLLTIGILLYVLGQSQSILMFAVASQIPVLFGILFLTQGSRGIRTFWFPILFLAFMIPLPGFLVDALTNPLKEHVSMLSEHILYFFEILSGNHQISNGKYEYKENLLHCRFIFNEKLLNCLIRLLTAIISLRWFVFIRRR